MLIKGGKLADAKRAARSLLDSADPHDLQVIATCAHILETWPKIGVQKLRYYWRTADEHDREIIAACAPEPGEQRRHQPQTAARQPRWTRKNRYQAPRDIQPAAVSDDAVVVAYQRDRAGMDDVPERAERPAGYALDYDRAAVPDLRATPCVRCWLERSTTDYSGEQDDGLCADCRDKGRPGIPVLPPDYTRADAVEARCAFIAEHFPAAARKLLRRYWHQCTDPDDRATVATCVQRHDPHGPEPADTATPPAEESAPPACSTCGEARTVRDLRNLPADDGLCTSCRVLDNVSTDSIGDGQKEHTAA